MVIQQSYGRQLRDGCIENRAPATNHGRQDDQISQIGPEAQRCFASPLDPADGRHDQPLMKMADEQALLRHGGETAGGSFRCIRRTIVVPEIFELVGVEPGLYVTEPAAIDSQVWPHRRHVIQYPRGRPAPNLFRDIKAEAKVMVAPNADRTGIAQQGNDFAGSTNGAHRIARIAQRHDLIHATAAKFGQRPLQGLDGFMDVCHNTNSHGLALLKDVVHRIGLGRPKGGYDKGKFSPCYRQGDWLGGDLPKFKLTDSIRDRNRQTTRTCHAP
jgi:hypothetical protein